MKLVINLLISSLAVFISAYILPGVEVPDLLTAVIVAVVLGVFNAVLKPVLVILTLPITLVTLGFFLFVINTLLVLLVAWLVPGFTVTGFVWALIFSLLVSITTSFLNSLT